MPSIYYLLTQRRTEFCSCL